ncbi:MAG TPA: hemerythrin domain-containing protein [Terriglobales bacterium]|nr:hemerythrin domain-containing protein [Terriglobales bacterium]
MPVQIGSATHSFSDPTGLLSDCHRRVEMFIGSLKAVADSSDRELSDESRRALETSLRYFREAAPKHTADEEESLFPRLRKIKDPALRSALERLDFLEKDHRWAEPLHAEVDELGTRYLQAGKLNQRDSEQFRSTVTQLFEMYRRHIEVEDRDVFPIAKKVLGPEISREIAAEMEARRGLKPIVSIQPKQRAI